MWPFIKCKECPKLQDWGEFWFSKANDCELSKKVSNLKWNELKEMPPINTNLLVANKDFTYFGFLYYEDGWDYSRKINMHGKGQIWATYTNSESINWWLNLDLIKR